MIFLHTLHKYTCTAHVQFKQVDSNLNVLILKTYWPNKMSEENDFVKFKLNHPTIRRIRNHNRKPPSRKFLRQKVSYCYNCFRK